MDHEGVRERAVAPRGVSANKLGRGGAGGSIVSGGRHRLRVGTGLADPVRGKQRGQLTRRPVDELCWACARMRGRPKVSPVVFFFFLSFHHSVPQEG
jgi:hypothetical protein